jgi:RNA 2',3'-cyclic 3'-phosphodiesterase
LLAEVEAAASALASAPFALQFDRAETWKRSQLLCLAASRAPSELGVLVEQLRRTLAALRMETEHKEFKAHITLAREWRDLPLHESVGPFAWPASEFVLVESHTGAGGSQYEVRHRWPLCSG